SRPSKRPRRRRRPFTSTSARRHGAHSVTELLDALRDRGVDVENALLDRGRALDKLYIPSRYPNGLPSGAPADYFTRAEAEEAIRHGEAVLAFCRRILSRPPGPGLPA